MDLVARKSWTRQDLAARLRRRGAPADLAAALVTELESRGYLDDAAFARAWVEARARARQIGPARLRAELRARGVDPALIDAAIRGSFGAGDELARALEVGRRRLPALVARDARRASARLRDHLLRRGYPAGVAAQVVRTLCGVETD